MVNNRNHLQEMCSGPEFALGEMYAIREFTTRQTKSGMPILGAVAHTSTWEPGHEAECAVSLKELQVEIFDALAQLPPEALEQAGIELVDRRPSKAPQDPFKNSNRLAKQLQQWYSGTSITAGAISANTVQAGSLNYSWNPDGQTFIRIKHQVPQPECTCGYYAYHSVKAMQANRYDEEWVGVIRAHGRIVVGEKGIRAQKADVVALVPTHIFFKQQSNGGSAGSARQDELELNAHKFAVETADTLVREGSFPTSKSLYDPVAWRFFKTKPHDVRNFTDTVAKYATSTEAPQQTVIYDASRSDVSYTDFNTLYLVSIQKSNIEREYAMQRKSLIKALTDFYVSEKALDQTTLKQHPDYARVAHLMPLVTSMSAADTILDIAATYPKAVFFGSVKAMLEQFPLTGPDEFRAASGMYSE